jgi:phage-related baseplate assembly protein
MKEKKEVSYLNKDFSEFRTNLVEFAKTYFPNTYTDFNEASPGTMIIEMAAYVGDVLSYYMDDQLKETMLAYATDRTNLLALASNIGYRPKNKVAATVKLDVFQLIPAKTDGSGNKVPDWDYALTVPAGMTVQAENTDIEFRTIDAVNFRASSSFNPTELSIYEIDNVTKNPTYYLLKKSVNSVAGTIVTATFDFTTPRRFDKLLLNANNIIEVISITDSDNNTWTEVPYLAQDTIFEAVENIAANDPELSIHTTVPYLLKLKKTARRYITRFRSNGFLEIQFGAGTSTEADEDIIPNPDNVGSSLIGLQMQFDHPIDPSNFMYTKSYGLAPANTTLTVKYTTGGGVESNVPSFTLKNITNIKYEINNEGLDATLLNRVKASVACTNPDPATGGKSEESIDDIRLNAMAHFAAQQRSVTAQDYVIRTYSMPARFGSIAKAYVIQDYQIASNNQTVPNPLALNLYTLGYNAAGNFEPLNRAVKENLQVYLNQYRMLTDAINIKDAFIVNIGIVFDIITLPNYNSNQVLVACINKLKELFNNNKMQINQPIMISKLYTELDRIEGVQTVTKIQIVNLHDTTKGYSSNVYDITAATKDGVIYPSLDPSIFEVKYMNQDIIGKVVSL